MFVKGGPGDDVDLNAPLFAPKPINDKITICEMGILSKLKKFSPWVTLEIIKGNVVIFSQREMS